MLISHPLVVISIAVLVWWISTGLVLFVVRRTEDETNDDNIRSTSFAMMSIMSVAAALGVALLVTSKHMLTPLGSYMGFFGALLLWAWHEASFLSGMITGPRKGDCPTGVDQWGRFKAAWEAVRSHELAIAVTVLLLYWLMMDAVNTFGFWTFMLLWIMRISAKLIIFLGARNALSDMMPKRISHLKTYFDTTHTSFLFFVSVSLASLVFVLLCIGAYETGEPYVRVGHVLLASFMALAIVEHFILILPISDAALWSWAMPRPHQANAPKSSPVGKYLPKARAIKPNTGDSASTLSAKTETLPKVQH